MGNLLIAIWAMILGLAVYGFGPSGVLVSLTPWDRSPDAISSAIGAWAILLGLPTLGVLLRRRKRE